MIPSTVPTIATSTPTLAAAGAVRVDAARLAPRRRSVPMLMMLGSGSAFAVTRRQRSTCHVATYAPHPRLAAQAFSGLPMGHGLFLGDNR